MDKGTCNFVNSEIQTRPLITIKLLYKTPYLDNTRRRMLEYTTLPARSYGNEAKQYSERIVAQA